LDQRLVELAIPESSNGAQPNEHRSEEIRKRRNKVKVLIVMSFAVTFGALADISLRNGMKNVSETVFQSPAHAFVVTITNAYVIAGILLMIAFLVLYLVSLSWENLSFVLPLTAADYVLVTLMAHFLLHEDVSPIRWLGSILVAVGIAVVART
jgi:drug/metabolite transporter (DMT)-like permease